MWNALKNAFKIPELRERILFTFFALAIFRLGVYIPIPGINIQAWATYFGTLSQGGAGGFIGFFDVFTGGAVEQFSIFLMSVTPYINAQIMLQLLTAVVPSLKEMLKEGEEGKKKYARYTRYLTIGLAGLQGFLISFGLSSNGAIMALPSRFIFVLLASTTLIGGTMFLLWLGERITEKGIGNGISILIFGGIVARYPASIAEIVVSLSPFQWAILLAIALFTVVAVIYVQMGERRIEVQYARRVTGRRVYGGVSTHIPIKVNQGGVIPIIFSSAIMMLPQFIATAFPAGSSGRSVMEMLFAQTSPLYILLYGGMVFFFTFFYSSLVFDVREVSDNIKNYGGYIPGIRPGFSTQQYIQRVLNRVVFMGAVFLVVIALLPLVMGGIFGIRGLAIGGTSTLIAVGVAIDILQQMETHLMVRHYEGFVKKGKLRGRR
ncbi:MAG TPA: preprotein translocase subunit SecY [Mesotoga sp.]|jgi:preprotein translocase subunit SecY|nr:preprotein translocase subunit SecY [Mesotoga sp.]MDI9374417.1 preprotein translocase subunit SecY [Thermotogota bacterium]NLX33636.1 preprotein translocase subunit SecY [Thermotogaceae bacterium]MDD4040470.1 preprotein translocase subunit SecY [Mesotoga sp.]MDD5743922.1 preprotein translocase subunit SecY [Mesotoga sp.]